MTKPSNARHQHVEDDILSKSASLFDELGFGKTSLQDIADAVGIARPSLYHYFRSKDEILATLIERSTHQREQIIHEVRSMQGSPGERLGALLRGTGITTAVNPAGLRLTLNNNGSLPPHVREMNARSRRMLFELLVEILREGIDAGVLRPMDEREAASTIIAALTGLQYRDIGGVHMSPERATAMLEQMLVAGITQPGERNVSGVDQAVSLLRHDIELLERHLARERPAP